MGNLEQYSRLLLTIYEGATDPAAWSRILPAVADWMAVDRTLMMTPWDVPGQGGFIFSHGITQQQIELWQTKYQPEDFRARRLIERNRVRQGVVTFGHELATPDELLASRWWGEFLSRLDLFHNVSGCVFDRETPGLPAVMFNCYRGRAQAPFEESDRRRLKLLIPHLSRALGVMYRLRLAEMQAAASLSALDNLSGGVLLFDAQGDVCFANVAARRMVALGEGLSLKTGHRGTACLSATHPVDAAQLMTALRGVLRLPRPDVRHFAHHVRFRRSGELADLFLQLSGLPESHPYNEGPTVPRAIGFLLEGDRHGAVDAELLQQVYGLTPAEARAAQALCHGGSIESVAAALDVTSNTLKTHLKRVYAKTTVSSRAGLTRLLMSLDSARAVS